MRSTNPVMAALGGAWLVFGMPVSVQLLEALGVDFTPGSSGVLWAIRTWLAGFVLGIGLAIVLRDEANHE